MDYLTIIATRSIILFPRSSNPSHNRPLQSPSAPQTPTSQLASPPPIAMPVESFISHDNDVAYFLLRHVLDTSLPSLAYGGLRQSIRDLAREAEVRVWQEMARAQSFTRVLGEWFGTPGHGRISEEELARLAKGCGVGLKRLKDWDCPSHVDETPTGSLSSSSLAARPVALA